MYNLGGTLTVSNTTLSGNRATKNSGGLYTTGPASLTNVTVSNNTADTNADESGDGGGVNNSGGTLTLKNSVVAGNFDNSPTPTNRKPDCAGVLTSQGYNLVGNTSGCTFPPTTGDQVRTDGSPVNPQLGTLGNNGGPTLTHALQASSPAINSGTNTGCPATDQRGYTRDATCDKDSYEYGAIPTVITRSYYYAGANSLLCAC